MKYSRRFFNWILALGFLAVSFGLKGQTNYFFSSVNGDDEALGTSSAAPWRSMDKLNDILPGLQPGDHIYLERGSSWFEVELELTNTSGSESSPIVFEAYGSGPRPILSGGKVLEGFTNNGNVYSATVEKNFPDGHIRVPTGILLNGVWKDIARSDEYFTQGTSSTNQLFDNNQSWATNQFAGGLVLLQPVHWQWNSSVIQSNTGTSLTFDELDFRLSNNRYFAYYIANTDNYLQKNGDWTFRNQTLKVYYESDLNSEHVQFSVVDSILSFTHCSDIIIRDIVFELANFRHLSIWEGERISVVDCEFRYTAGTSVKFRGTDYITFENNYVHDCGAAGIWLSVFGPADVKHNLFRRISTQNIGMVNYDFRMGPAITIHYPVNSNPQIQYNYFDSVGLAIQGHTFNVGESANISCNYIQNYGISVSDCAAIYFASDLSSTTNRYVSKNIIREAITAGNRYLPYGDNATNPHPTLHPHAIYLDENAKAYVCDSNSIYNACIPFYVNRNLKNSFTNNNVVKGDKYLPDRYNTIFYKDQAIGDTDFSADKDTVRNNNFVLSNNPAAGVYMRHTISANISLGIDQNQFYFDYNKIAAPFNADAPIGKYLLNYGDFSAEYSLAEMQTDGGNVSSIPTDLSSVVNPQSVMYSDVSGQVSEDEFVKFYTNFSAQPKTFQLGSATFRDIDGNLVSGSVTVAPFYSKILFYLSGDINSVAAENYIDSTLVPPLTMGANGTVNHPPVILDSEFTIYESEPQPLYIGTVPAEDPDYAQGLSFSISSGNTENFFAISNSGALNLTTTDISFRGNPSYYLTVRATDNGTPSLSSEGNVTLHLVTSHVNRPPIFENQDVEFRLEEGTTSYTANIVAIDPDEEDALSLELLSVLPEEISIDLPTGLLTYVPGEAEILEPISYEISMRAVDDGFPPLSTNATIYVTIVPGNGIIYIDATNTQFGDGTYSNPYSYLESVDFQSDFHYLIKRGTNNTMTSKTIDAENVVLGSYGEGALPIITSYTGDYVFMSSDNKKINFEDLHIVAENAVSCLYLLGSDGSEARVENCILRGADYGVRSVNTTNIRIQYCKVYGAENGIYLLGDNLQVNYNIIGHNVNGINIVSNEEVAEVYNNVFFDNRQALVSASPNVKILNSIFYLSQNSDIAISSEDELLLSDHNLYYPVKDGFVQIEGSSYNNVQELRDNLTQDLSSVDTDPKFIDLAAENFDLQSSSPAIDAALYVGIFNDIFGNPIPYGNAPDIGVVEADKTPSGVGINDFTQDDFVSIYPNPVNDLLYVRILSEGAATCRIRIFNLHGTTLKDQQFQTYSNYSGNQFVLNASGFDPGVYMIEVVHGEKTQVQKFIVAE